MKVVLKSHTTENGVEYALVDYRDSTEVVRVHEWKKGNVEVFCGDDLPRLFTLSLSDSLSSQDLLDYHAIIDAAMSLMATNT